MGIRIDSDSFNNLRFTDDIIILSDSEENLGRMIKELFRGSLKVGLIMNIKKTKDM